MLRQLLEMFSKAAKDENLIARTLTDINSVNADSDLTTKLAQLVKGYDFDGMVNAWKKEGFKEYFKMPMDLQEKFLIDFIKKYKN